MSQYQVLCDLLPLGKAFSKDNKYFHDSLKNLANHLEAAKTQIQALFKEDPRNFKATLNTWTRLFEINKSNDPTRISQEVAARLTAQGGQSKAYLENQLNQYSKTPIRLEALCQSLQVKVHGVCESFKAKAGTRVGQQLTTYKRNDAVVKRFKTIRHAEIEARYY